MRRGASGLHGAHVHVHDTTLLYRSFFVREGGRADFLSSHVGVIERRTDWGSAAAGRRLLSL